MSRAEKSKQIFDHRKEKTEVSVTVALKLACDKDKAAVERQQNATRIQPKLFWKWLVSLARTSTVTSDFNHPRKEYINCISSDLSAEMMSTQNDGQNWLEPWIMIFDQVCSNTKAIFHRQYSRRSKLHYVLKILSHISISCIYLGKSFYMYLKLAKSTLLDRKFRKVTLEVTLYWKPISHEEHLVFLG